MENNWGIGTTNWGKFSSRTPGAAPVWSPHFHFFLLLFFLKMDLVWWWSSQGGCHAVTQAGVYFTSGTHCQRLETLIVLFRCPKDLHKKSFNLTFFFFPQHLYDKLFAAMTTAQLRAHQKVNENVTMVFRTAEPCQKHSLCIQCTLVTKLYWFQEDWTAHF